MLPERASPVPSLVKLATTWDWLVPAVFFSIPWLRNWAVVGVEAVIEALLLMSNTDPGRLFQTAPSLIPRLPLPVQVRVPAFSTVRGPRPRRVLDVIELAPASTVLPAPIIEPPAQMKGPATVSVPSPVIADPPPVNVRLAKVTSAATVSK